MREENVALFWGWVEAINRFDREWIIEHVAEDVEFIPLRAGTEGSFRGREGVRRFLEDTEESFDVFQLSVSEVRTAGDTVVGIGTIRVRGKSSGIETDVPSAGVTTFSKGLMTHFKDYGDRQEALRAAGLG